MLWEYVGGGLLDVTVSCDYSKKCVTERIL